MKGTAIALLLVPLLAASAPAQPQAEPLDNRLRQARAEQAAAEAEAAKLQQTAARAKGEAERLHAGEAAAAQAIEAAEARITAADMQYRLASAYVAAHRQRLAEEQQPMASLLAGLATMARRPPLLALSGAGDTDELVKVRILVESTLPVIRRRTAAVASELLRGEQLQQAALSARMEMVRSRQELGARRQQFAAREQRSMRQALAVGGQALSASDVAIAAGENIEDLRREQSNSRSSYALAEQLADEDAAPARPFASQQPQPRLAFRYELPAEAGVTEGLAAVNDSGVRSRGLTLSTSRGSPVSAPADGTVRFSGPFRDYDGVLIIDHGGGWMSLIVNVSSPLHPGDEVRMGDQIGRALGPLQVELSHNGRRISPALIAGSSQTLSKGMKGS
ncbi:MAG TPA: M23 family metallopeptidase [Sphingomicrobium sp.]|nr:M23 family metallopeptidase [Sphingomicrobium sp.]